MSFFPDVGKVKEAWIFRSLPSKNMYGIIIIAVLYVHILYT